MQVLDDLFKGSFIRVNKGMIKIFGLEAAVMLGELYSEYKYWESNNGLTEYGYFYSTRENVENNIGLTRAKQDKAISLLEEYGIIKKYVHGMPAKRYFKFEMQGIIRLKEDLESDCFKVEEIKIVEERQKKRVCEFQANW